jgi:GTP pyrophosphokinase
VIGPYGERIEIQIRSHEMHRVAEEGIAAHWRYKEGEDFHVSDLRRFSWLRQLLEWQKTARPSGIFAQPQRRFVLDVDVRVHAQRRSFEFPQGLDRDRLLHIGFIPKWVTVAQALGSTANSVSLRYILRSGDTVEIITTPQQAPTRDWLKWVKTPRAQSKIRNWLKAQQRERSVVLGRQILESDLHRYQLDLRPATRRRQDRKRAERIGGKRRRGLLAAIGYGRLTTRHVLAKLVSAGKIGSWTEKGRRFAAVAVSHGVQTAARFGIRVKGVDDVLVRFALCCHPLPGEPIIGFITRGRGVTVHTVGCPTVLESDPHRKTEVSWEENAKRRGRSRSRSLVSISRDCWPRSARRSPTPRRISPGRKSELRASVRSTPLR